MIDSSTTDHVEDYTSQESFGGPNRFNANSNPDPSINIVRKVKAHMKARENQEYPAEPGCDEPWTDQQEEAMLYVIEGLPVSEAAQNVAVNRRTVHRWMHHPRFQRALKERDQNLALTLQMEMTAVVQESFSSLSKSLQKDNYTAALRFLKKVGLLDGTPIFEHDAILLDQLTKPPTSESTDEDEETGHVGHGEDEEAGANSQAEGETDSETEQNATSKVRHVRHAAKQNAENKDSAGAKVRHVRHEDQTEADQAVNEFQQYALDLVHSGESLFAAVPLNAEGLQALRILTKKPEFQAGLKIAHQHLQAHWRLQGKHLALLAVDCIRRALANHHGRVAIVVLKGLGVL